MAVFNITDDEINKIFTPIFDMALKAGGLGAYGLVNRAIFILQQNGVAKRKDVKEIKEKLNPDKDNKNKKKKGK